MSDLLYDYPYLLLVLYIGCALAGAVGLILLAIALYGFFRWVELTKRRIARHRSKLHYKDML